MTTPTTTPTVATPDDGDAELERLRRELEVVQAEAARLRGELARMVQALAVLLPGPEGRQ